MGLATVVSQLPLLKQRLLLLLVMLRMLQVVV